MGRTWIRQDVQIASTTTTTAGYSDSVAPSLANFQTNAATLTDDLNNLRSMTSHLLDVQVGNWYDTISTPSTFENGAQRGVDDLNQDLHDYERKRVLREVTLLSDVGVAAYVAGTGTLSLNSQVSNNDTVTTGTHTYTFKTVLTPLADEVLIGALATDSLDNLISAINNAPGGAGSGTLWAAATTANGFVTAVAGAGDTMDVTAIIPGTQGNLIATTDTLTDVASVWTNGALLTGGAGDVEILLIGELPTQTTAAIGAVTTLGTVAAFDATFGTVSATAVVTAGTAVAPGNMVEIVDGSTRDPILDGSGQRIWGLFQTESNTDGSTMTGTTPFRAQISFVVLNATGDGLEPVDATYIGGKTVNYTYIERKALEDLNEYDFLRGAAVDIGSGAATITRQAGYTNQGISPVDLVTNAILDLEGAGLSWLIRDDLESNLFGIIEGSAGGTSQVNIYSDVDEFDVDAAVNDFAAGATLNSGGVRPITIGVTDGMIATTAGDLEIQSAAELWFDDANKPAGWSLATGILLSDTAQEWTDFEANFGEVSLMDAINQAYEDQVRSKVQAVLTANVAADTDVNGPAFDNNTDVNLLPYNSVPTSFVADVEIYLNGELLRNAANDGGGEDVYPGGTPADGDLKFQFPLRGVGANPDQLTVIVNGQ